MKFILSSLLVFLCVFAKAQVPPPMVLGGPQGIDVTRLLARNWMSTPIYTDTPSSPLTGAGWPGRGYLITVVRNETACQSCPPKDTTLWMYTGARWKRVGYDYLTRLVYGGTVSKVSGQNLRYLIQPYGAFFDGDYKIGATAKTATLTSKSLDSTSRIDVLVLNRDSFQVKTGIPTRIPQKPLVTGSEVEIASFYFKPFDSIPAVTIGQPSITNIFRVPGVDSIYYSVNTQIFAIKDSIGITKNDTAFMLNNYKFTAANGLTKDSTVFRLGGSLNQNTNINLNTRRLSFIGGSDTTRFFSNGRVSIGGTPDSSHNFRVNGITRLNGNTTYNGNILPFFGATGAASQNGAVGLVSGASGGRVQGYYNGGASRGSYIDFPTSLLSPSINIVRSDNESPLKAFDSIVFGYDYSTLDLGGVLTSTRGGGNTFSNFRINPIVRIGPSTTQLSYLRGVDFRPTLDSFNNVRFIPFTNTVGSNMFNTTSGNTRIGYPLGILTNQNTTAYDTTFKLDVNGDTRIDGKLNFATRDIKIGTNATGANAVIAIGQQASVDNYSKVGTGRAILIGFGNGNNWGTVGNNDISIGQDNKLSTTGSANGSIQIGTSLRSSGSSTLIGSYANDNGFNVISIDRLLPPEAKFNFTANNQTYIRGQEYFLGTAGTDSVNVTINGNRASSSNKSGGNITIAGGRGNGNATPGAVIFSTSTRLPNAADTTTLQTLTERARISERGNLLVGTSTDDTSSLVNIVSTTKGFLQPRMTNTQRDAITTPATGLQLFNTTDSANYVYRGGGGWQKIANEISGSFTINFPATNNGTHSDVAVTLTGATAGDVVSIGVPDGSVLNHSCYTAWVSADNEVTVRFNNYGSGNLDPASGTFKIKVFK